MIKREPILLLVLACAISTGLSAQYGDLAAMTPPRTVARTADDTRIAIAERSSKGVFSVDVPEDCYRIDLLNAKGRVKYQLDPSDRRLQLDRLRPGTWTLRAHTTTGIMVRRFLVFKRGHAPWAIPGH